VSPKRARVSQSIQVGKNPVVTQSTQEDNTRRVSWRFGDADLNGRWRWTEENIGKDALKVLKFLAEMDKLTWAEAQQGHRPRLKRVETAGICAEAQSRLRSLGRVDLEYLYEWHLSGPERIWGSRESGSDICHVLWWDSDHSVWPSERD